MGRKDFGQWRDGVTRWMRLGRTSENKMHGMEVMSILEISPVSP
jgi:hypothetical protein